MVGQNDIELLNAKDVKRMLKISLPMVYRLASEGRLACVRIPCRGAGAKKRQNLVRFKAEDVYGFIEQHYQT